MFHNLNSGWNRKKGGIIELDNYYKDVTFQEFVQLLMSEGFSESEARSRVEFAKSIGANMQVGKYSVRLIEQEERV